MYWDTHKKARAIQRRMACRTRIAWFTAGSLLHLVLAVLVLLWQTSCDSPRCVEGIHFDIVRGAMRVPLFLTPWLGLPSPELEFHRAWPLFGWLVLNALMAVVFYWGLTLACRRGYVAWQAWLRTRKRPGRASRPG